MTRFSQVTSQHVSRHPTQLLKATSYAASELFCALSLHWVLFAESLDAQTVYISVKSLAMQEPEPGTFCMQKKMPKTTELPRAPQHMNEGHINFWQIF